MEAPPIFLVNHQACVVPVATGAKKVRGSITSSIWVFHCKSLVYVILFRDNRALSFRNLLDGHTQNLL